MSTTPPGTTVVLEEPVSAPDGKPVGTAATRAWTAPPAMRRTVARLVQLIGLVNAALSALPGGHRFPALADLMPTAGMVTARATTGVVGVLLIYLGAGLRRGKHRAWQLALALSGLSAVLHLAKGGAAAAASAVAISALLIVNRDQFRAAGDPRNRWRALHAAALFLAAGFVLGFAEIAVRQNRLIGDPGVWRWAEHAGLGLFGVTGPIRFQYPIGGAIVGTTTGAFGAVACAIMVLLLLRSGSGPAGPDPAGDARMRDLLDGHGDGDSLGYFALRHDKRTVWAPSGKAAVAYRVINGVSLASGDPLGLPSEWPQAIAL